MQKMSSTNSDTHDHGPPTMTTTTNPTLPGNLSANSLTTTQPSSQFPRIAKWSTSWSPAAVNSFSGAMAGMASGIVTCPLDVIKTKLQAQGSFRARSTLAEGVRPIAMYNGMLGTARTIYTQDGLRGMYRGLGPMLLGYLPTWAVYMSVYDSTREYWYNHGYGEHDRDKWLARVYASLTAGACSTLATNPIWVIKTRLMSQVSKGASKEARTPWHYANTFDAARKMYKAEGLGAFYSGLAPALLGLTHVAIQFPLYEYFKQSFTGVEMGAPTPDNKPGEAPGRNTLGILAATFLSKVCATSATYPHEVVRTRLQTQQRHHVAVNPRHHVDDRHPHSGGGAGGATTNLSSSSSPPRPAGTTPPSSSAAAAASAAASDWKPHYRGVLDTCRTILREEGWRAFYNGMGTNMIRAVPAAMTTMLTYESVKGWIGRLQEEGREIQEREEGGLL